MLLVMNKATYEGLPDDLRAILDAHTGMETATLAGKHSTRAGRRQQAAEKRGNKIFTLSEEETARWREKTRPVVDSWLARRRAGRRRGQAAGDGAGVDRQVPAGAEQRPRRWPRAATTAGDRLLRTVDSVSESWPWPGRAPAGAGGAGDGQRARAMADQPGHPRRLRARADRAWRSPCSRSCPSASCAARNLFVDTLHHPAAARGARGLDGFWALVYAAVAALIAARWPWAPRETSPAERAAWCIGLPIGWAIAIAASLAAAGGGRAAHARGVLRGRAR